MQNVPYRIIPDPARNSISYSKNHRIFTTSEPLRGSNGIIGFSELLDYGSAIESNITRKLRYSTNKLDWSLWYDFAPNNISELTNLYLENTDVFFEIKYEYDDGTYDELTEPLQVERIIISVSTTKHNDISTIPSYSTNEISPELIIANEALFKPYEASSAIDVALELSSQVNQIYGHQVIYFKTEPDRDGGDFVFKEWTLFKTTQRQCIKVMVPENTFPDNRPNYSEFGIDFDIPFEIHIDNIYFQQIFGRNKQPRKRDYLFFPMLNRMYEVQGAYLYRGFMMEPMYWRIQLTRFHPNIDMYMKAEDRKFLDNLIMTTEQLYGDQTKIQEKDALAKQQYRTISSAFDEVRQTMHPEIRNKVLDLKYNYAPLIEYYYDMSLVIPQIKTYQLDTTNTPDKFTQHIVNNKYAEIYAYEDSQIYLDWINRKLVTTDSYVNSTNNVSTPIKTNGPKESFTNAGKYVVIENYKTLSLKNKEQQNINIDNTISFRLRQNAIVYKQEADTNILPNMTFCELIRFNVGTYDTILFSGFDDVSKQGLIISAKTTDLRNKTANLTLYVQVNNVVYTFNIGQINYLEWYAIIIPISAQYGQLEVNMYSFKQDPSNIKNFNGLIKLDIANSYRNIGKFEYITTAKFCLPGSNISAANIRLFNTMLREEDHEFVISQLFIRDESLLAIIDNARPKLNVPFVSISR